MSAERINLAELRAVVEADGYPNAQDVLALVEAVEAAQALADLYHYPASSLREMELARALARFSFEDSDA